MSRLLFTLAKKAKNLPELALLGRIALGAAGAFVLLPVATNLLRFSELGLMDYVGLVVFSAVGIWLLAAAIKKR